MRTEHPVEAEGPTAELLVERGKPRAATAPGVRRLRISRSRVRTLAAMLDLIATSLVTVGLCLAAGYGVWSVPAAAAPPFVLLPVLCVASVWIAGGYRFRHGDSIVEHMFRVGIGAATAMSVVFLAVLVFALDQADLFAPLCVANALAVFALHGNYLGIVCVATRQGYVSDAMAAVDATQSVDQLPAR